jgi:uncharacterized membrane protein YfhO
VGSKSGQKIDIYKIQIFTHQILGIHFEETIDQLKSDSLKLEKFSGDYLRGTIHTDTDKMLFFSILYDHGWSARLNGKEWPLKKINFGFLGLEIPPGKHTVELQFRPRLFYPGIFISILSVLITGVCYFRFPTYKLSRKKRA